MDSRNHTVWDMYMSLSLIIFTYYIIKLYFYAQVSTWRHTHTHTQSPYFLAVLRLECIRNTWEAFSINTAWSYYSNKIWFSIHEVDLRIFISNTFPDNGNVAGLQISLTRVLAENSPRTFMTSFSSDLPWLLSLSIWYCPLYISSKVTEMRYKLHSSNSIPVCFCLFFYFSQRMNETIRFQHGYLKLLNEFISWGY